MDRPTDVAIIGGGLAGLTLALQLRESLGDSADIMVLERNRHPVPAAAYKVGESTVEIGTRYLADVIGMRDHLESAHLPKFGLRLFFGSERNDTDVGRLDEIGASTFLPVRSYQIDRGILENTLGEAIVKAGVEFRHSARVTGVQVSEDGGRHTARFVDEDGSHSVSTRWLVDAGSRAGPLRARLNIQQCSGHDNHAVWFRLKAPLKIDEWTTDTAWQDRCVAGSRWLSTNHFMGPGYWVWFIPLASGCTSVGIVADPAIHPTSRFPDFDATMDWLKEFQPNCFRVIEPVRDKLMDFRYLRRYSHGARQVFSPQRWALTGEAGVFADPFYSPGSDFIGISNTFVTELISDDLAGKNIAGRCSVLQELYFSFFKSTLELYVDQYAGFGDLRLMACKTTWDYAYYWAVLAKLFFGDQMADPRLLGTLGSSLLKARSLNQQVQRSFRARAAERRQETAAGRFVDQCQIPCLWNLNSALRDGPETLVPDIAANVGMLGDLSEALLGLLHDPASQAPGVRERELLGDLRNRLAA